MTNPAPVPPPPAPSPPLSSWRLLGIWLSLGLQSFGGGGATLTLIRRAAVERHGWVSERDFDRDWAICQVCPGINLLALSALTGRRIAGARGVALCLLGLLLPTVVVTVILTAFYARIRDAAMVKNALQAVLPASVGLGLLTVANIVSAQLKASRQNGRAFPLFDLTLLASSGALLLAKPPVVVILLAAASVSALFHALYPSNKAKRRAAAGPKEGAAPP